MNTNPPRGGNAISAAFGRFMLKLSGWKIVGQLPSCPKMVIAVGPHTSNWDFFLGVAVLFVLRIKISFLGKHSIFVTPFKQFLVSIGGIPVDRRSAHGVVDQVVDAFNQHPKMILALAPEGTRSPIFPWKSGFLAIAHKAKVPVLLIGFDFKNKQVDIQKLIETSGDFEQDMQKVYAYFEKIPAKYPANVIFKSSP
ncbi:lysophospholipid acyltransferase family protein [Glaciecola petra]|uniref:Lysophospholipid acyltransferase family protein n=1 Tax=Glaciecola petra TaxID=3075602 RepID=A0ABU2ZM47_9ALTE|nr:lysophospholipid acyltransferase family protein [Aestuariibacter sp. P117]MDT0593424.1 lysophospholipid acyltransferase family protein [Aestuariibacter sp. P117]